MAEGTAKKFIKEVEQINFSGKRARLEQTILYVTERCVFQLMDGRMLLIEIAPSIDLERDVLAHMDFVPEISLALKVMYADTFRET